MRVGVTGASGLIGTALIEALRERSDDVVSFQRPSSKSVAGDVVRWDPSRGIIDESDLRRVGGFDAIVNLAGAGIGDKRWSKERKAEILNSRTSAAALIGQIARAAPNGVGHLVNASAIGWYGSRGDEVLDETSARGSGFLADVCDAWESAATAVATSGTIVARLRTGIVLSARGGALKKQLPLFQFGLGGRMGSGNQWLSPISLADEVAAILWVLDHRLEGPFNLTAPSPLTNRSFAHELAALMHRPAVVAVPSLALRVVLGREMADELVLSGQRVLPQRLLASGFTFTQPEVRSALEGALAAAY
jgi:uncharacterized protein (TIGR01777 family)